MSADGAGPVVTVGFLLGVRQERARVEREKKKEKEKKKTSYGMSYRAPSPETQPQTPEFGTQEKLGHRWILQSVALTAPSCQEEKVR